MDLNDLKLLSKLIKIYGIDNVVHAVELNKIFLSYMNKKGIDNPSEICSMYCETETEQIFTNGETSIFCLEPNTIDFELLKSDNLLSMYECVNRDEIQKYFELSKKLLGWNVVDVSCISFLNNSIIGFGANVSAEKLSNIEAELMRLLFTKTKIKASYRNPIIHIEADNGYAYILGKTNGRTNKF